jgi:hypothetical protein
MKVMESKAKDSREALTGEESQIPKATKEKEFNVPQPIAMYVHHIV